MNGIFSFVYVVRASRTQIYTYVCLCAVLCFPLSTTHLHEQRTPRNGRRRRSVLVGVRGSHARERDETPRFEIRERLASAAARAMARLHVHAGCLCYIDDGAAACLSKIGGLKMLVAALGAYHCGPSGDNIYGKRILHQNKIVHHHVMMISQHTHVYAHTLIRSRREGSSSMCREGYRTHAVSDFFSTSTTASAAAPSAPSCFLLSASIFSSIIFRSSASLGSASPVFFR